MSTSRISYRDAIAEALRMEMHRDAAVVFLEQDRGPAAEGGATGATRGFGGLFGERLVELETTADGLLGAAAGAAAAGLRAVCEVPLGELGGAALGALAQAVELHRAEELEMPLVLLVPLGGFASDGPASGILDPEERLLGLDGLGVVAPTTPEDAKGVLVGAIRQSQPICVLEHEALGGLIAAVPEGAHVQALGEARIARRGERLTVIAWGPASLIAERAAERIDDGIEVVDLRSLCPLDVETVLGSVKRTGRVVIVEEAGRSSRVSAELTKLIWDRAFEYLDAPLGRATIGAAQADDISVNGHTAAPVRTIEEVCLEALEF